jgi:uncharacterized protein
MMPVLKRMLSSLIFILVAVWICLCMLLYVFQSNFIYFPSQQLSLSPEDINLKFENVSLITEDKVSIHGWYIPHPDSKQTLLFLHGNAGNISHRLDSLNIFHQLGLSILIIDYRGYGQSEGKTTEAGTYQDAETAWNYLINDRHLSGEDIIIFGRSLGGGVASWLAQKHLPAALILESTFTSISDMAALIYPYLPVKWMSRIHYASIERIDKIHCPILFIHSPDDELVPYHLGQKLYQRAEHPKSFMNIGGGHNDGFMSSQPNYSRGIYKFIQQLQNIPSNEIEPKQI